MDSAENAINILLGNGDGTFTPGTTIFGVGNNPCILPDQPSNCSLVVADFNHDGNADLAATSGADNTVIILLGHGDGTFTQANGSPISVGSFPEAVRTGDFNSDGILDLAVANAKDNTVSILLGNGDGTFTQASGSPVSVGAFPFFVAVADFNGDGFADIAVSNESDSTVSILLGHGDGTFARPAARPSLRSTTTPARWSRQILTETGCPI